MTEVFVKTTMSFLQCVHVVHELVLHVIILDRAFIFDGDSADFCNKLLFSLNFAVCVW